MILKETFITIIFQEYQVNILDEFLLINSSFILIAINSEKIRLHNSTINFITYNMIIYSYYQTQKLLVITLYLILPQCYSCHSLVMALLSVFILFSTISLLLADTQENEASGWVTILDPSKSSYIKSNLLLKTSIEIPCFSSSKLKAKNI